MHHPVTWSEQGLPVSAAYDDPFFTGGADEAVHVFLAGNDLPARLRDGFRVAELGFGTGLNLLVLARAWADAGAGAAGGTLRFTSFESLPLAAADMARALAPFGLPGTEALVAQWAAGGEGERALALPGVAARVILGDAAQTLPRWDGDADAWFLDGFAPARNPGLWTPQVLAQVARRTAPGGTAATYTAAGHVRRALQAAGFAVDRVPGYGRKRHMTRARMP